MARHYLDTSAPGNEYQAYAANMTIGGNSNDYPLPMDGNGKAGPGHSAAVARALIDCTSATAAAGNTLTVCGATALTCVASGAAANQFNAGSGSTLATNLVSCINSATSTVHANASALTLGIQYFLWARVDPGNANIVQVFTRCAGGDLNNASNSQMTIANNAWAASPTVTQFTGGMDGPFAYYIGAGGFGKSYLAYGIRTALAATKYDPHADSDSIYVRCSRGGVNLAVQLALVVATYISTSVVRKFIYDSTGSIWPGDSGQFTFKISQGYASSSVYLYNASTFRDIALSEEGFRILYSCPYTSSPLRVTGNTGVVLYHENVTLEEETSSSIITVGVYINSNTKIHQLNPTIRLRSGHAPWGVAYSLGGLQLTVVNQKTIYQSLSVDVGYLYDPSTLVSYGAQHITFLGGSISTGGGAYKVVNLMSSAVPTFSQQFYISCVDVVGLSNAVFNFAAWGRSNYVPYGEWQDPGIDASLRVDTQTCVVDWIANAVPPYPSNRTVLPSGKGQSIRVAWYSFMEGELLLPWTTSTFNRLPTGVRSIQFDFLSEALVASTTADVGAILTYFDGAVWRTQCSCSEQGGSYPESTEPWINIPSGFVRKKIVFETLYPCATGYPVKLVFTLRKPASTTTSFYVDPTLGIS